MAGSVERSRKPPARFHSLDDPCPDDASWLVVSLCPPWWLLGVAAQGSDDGGTSAGSRPHLPSAPRSSERKESDCEICAGVRNALHAILQP